MNTYPIKKESDFKTRLGTAALFVSIALFLICFNKVSLTIFFLIVAIGCGYEYLRLFINHNVLPLVIVLLQCGIFVYFHYVDNDAANLFLALFSIAFMLYSFLALYVKKALNIHHIFPVGMCLSLIITPLYLLGNLMLMEAYNFRVILFIILMIWSADTFAYLVGRKLGKRKLFPSVSPNKSWEGFLGSGLITISLGFLLGINLLPQMLPSTILMLIVAAWLIGGIGDLVQSSIKRYADVKDSGDLFPGHGGMWDRFDSFIFMCPFAFLIIKYLG